VVTKSRSIRDSGDETFSFEELWNRQLDLQVRTFFSADAKFLKTLSAFKNGKHILEIGSGNGAFLAQLAKAHPKKTFRGIDASAMLVSHARHRLQFQPNVSVDVKDLYQMGPADGDYDVLFARLVVQHLPDLPRFLEVAERLLKPGGHLIIVEAEDKDLWLEPQCPEQIAIFARTRKHQTAGGPAAALRSIKRAARNHGLEMVREAVVTKTIKGSGRTSVRQLWENAASLVQKAWNIKIRMADLRRQLARWEETPGSKAHFGYRYTIFRKAGLPLTGWLGFFKRMGR